MVKLFSLNLQIIEDYRSSMFVFKGEIKNEQRKN